MVRRPIYKYIGYSLCGMLIPIPSAQYVGLGHVYTTMTYSSAAFLALKIRSVARVEHIVSSVPHTKELSSFKMLATCIRYKEILQASSFSL